MSRGTGKYNSQLLDRSIVIGTFGNDSLDCVVSCMIGSGDCSWYCSVVVALPLLGVWLVYDEEAGVVATEGKLVIEKEVVSWIMVSMLVVDKLWVDSDDCN